MGVAFGDYDGDGKLDIFVANDTMPNFLFRNEGNGTFSETGLAAGVAYNPDGVASSRWASTSAITTIDAAKIFSSPY